MKKNLFAYSYNTVTRLLVINHRAYLRIQGLYILPIILAVSGYVSRGITGINLLASDIDEIISTLVHSTAFICREFDSDISSFTTAIPVAVYTASDL